MGQYRFRHCKLTICSRQVEANSSGIWRVHQKAGVKAEEVSIAGTIYAVGIV